MAFTKITEYRPTPVQELMLSSYADMILYGGARAGGKTFAAILWFTYRIENPNHRGLVIRRNAKDLTDFVDRAGQVWRELGAKKTGNPAKFTFPSGAIIYTGHLGTEDAYTSYQGHEYDAILIEELTHIPTKLLFEKLMGSLRSMDTDLNPQFLGTTNPGGAGNEWVKSYWHILDPDVERGVEFTEEGIVKIYIPATIEDNPHLMEADPKYYKWLKTLPPDLRAKWLEGSWEDIDTENQYYATRITRMKKDGRVTAVPFEAGLRTFTAWDLGISDQMVLWTYQLHGKELRIVDCYSNRNQPLKHYSDYLYDLAAKFEVNIEKLFVPHDANVRSMTSDTLMTRYEKLVKLGWNVEMVPNIGIDDGIDAVREILAYCWIDESRTKGAAEDKYPGGSKDGLRALRAYQREFDDKMNRYKDSPLHDWASDYADSFRYLALSLALVRSGLPSPIVKMQQKQYENRGRNQNRRKFRR